MGATLSFTIPVAMGIINKEDEKYLSKGIMAGISTIPFGCFFGGLIAGFNIKMLILNLIPTIIFTFLFAQHFLNTQKLFQNHFLFFLR